MYAGIHTQFPYSPYLNLNWLFSTDFRKIYKCQISWISLNFLNFHENRWTDGRTDGQKDGRTDGRTDGETWRSRVAHRNIANAPKNRSYQEISHHVWNSTSNTSHKPATGLLMWTRLVQAVLSKHCRYQTATDWPAEADSLPYVWLGYNFKIPKH